MSAHRAHRHVRPARPAARIALSAAAVLTLGAGPLVGLAAAAPVVTGTDSTVPAPAVGPSASGALGAPGAGGAGDALWYGLLASAAVAGAAGAHQLVGGRPRRRA